MHYADPSIETVDYRRLEAGSPVPVLRITDLTTTGSYGYALAGRVVTDAEQASGKLEQWLKIPESAGTSNINIIVSSDIPASDPPSATLPANRRTAEIGPSNFVRDAWNGITLALDSILAAPFTWSDTGSPDHGIIRSIYFECIFAPEGLTGQRYMLLSDTANGGKTTTLINLTFDGYLDETIALALPILQARGFTATFFLDSNLIASNTAKLDILYAAGWDIGCRVSSLAEYQAGQTALVAAGYTRSLGILAWANAASTPTLRAQVKAAGARWARDASLVRTPYTSLGRDELVNAGCYDTGDAANAAAMIAYHSEAMRASDPYAMLTHQLVQNGTKSGPLQTEIGPFTVYADALVPDATSGTAMVIPVSRTLALTGG